MGFSAFLSLSQEIRSSFFKNAKPIYTKDGRPLIKGENRGVSGKTEKLREKRKVSAKDERFHEKRKVSRENREVSLLIKWPAINQEKTEEF